MLKLMKIWNSAKNLLVHVGLYSDFIVATKLTLFYDLLTILQCADYKFLNNILFIIVGLLHWSILHILAFN